LQREIVAVREYIDRFGKSNFGNWFNDLNGAAAAKVTHGPVSIDARKFLECERRRHVTALNSLKRTKREMALTKDFRETTYARAQRDAAFRKSLLTEAVNAYFGGEEAVGKARFERPN